MRALWDWEPSAVFLCFSSAFPFPVLFFVDFLFLGQLEGGPIVSVEVSLSGGLLRGDGSCSESGPDTKGLCVCASTELFGSVVRRGAASITGADTEEVGVL